MTTLEHYSRDLPKRCERLIERLMPVVEGGLPGDGDFGGPLKTTFLLALATPMLILPVERMFKRSGVADDWELDDRIDARVAEILGSERPFGKAPFAGAGWGYISRAAPFNIAGGWPPEHLDRLGSREAGEAAQNASAWRILKDLRNALAHGGVAYLDGHGRNSEGEAVMLAFAGAIMKDGKIVALNLLRVHQDDFRRFLSDWSKWISATDVTYVLSEAPNLEG
jgi:hypothetical protein